MLNNLRVNSDNYNKKISSKVWGDTMRIDSNDAISNFGNFQNRTAAIGQVNAADAVKREATFTEIKRISQITDYEKENMPVSERVVIQAIEKANRAISGGNRRFEFSIHEKTNEIMIKVIDSDTNQLIREIPNEKILDMVAKMWEMAGIMVDERR